MKVALNPALLAGPQIVLHIEAVKLPPGAAGIVRVFADLPEANAHTSVEDPHYLGYFTVLAKNSAEAAKGLHAANTSLDITGKKLFFQEKKEMTLTLVPLGASEEKNSVVRKVSVGRAYLSPE